ncbi:hypothetical protein Lal_00027225 [Lupinus albus]|nr:hypothetical protein Lal_00027225 [Lupinus albus]
METEGQLISWSTFKAKFLYKYFPADLKRQKEMEFLKLEQGNMSVGEYAAKIEELARFCPYSELEVDGRSKCSKFESGLRSKLKRMFRHQEIADFATLVNKCLMYEDDLKVDELATPETISPRNYGTQRNHMRERGKGRVEDDWKPYAVTGHRDRSFQRSSPPIVPTDEASTPMCIKCGRLHYGSTCPGKGNECFHCKELGHIKRFCPKLDRRLNVIHAEETRNHGRRVTPRVAGTLGVDDPARGKSHGDSSCGVWVRRNHMREEFWGCVEMNVQTLFHESWKSRLSERFSPERERILWEGEILGYTGGFSPERELSRLSESCLAWARNGNLGLWTLGSGLLLCPTRSGSGLLLCPTRSGSGPLLCPARSGSGPLLCPARSGSGLLLCPTRSGSGPLLCPTRSGSGPLLCPTRSGSRPLLCPTQSGSGLLLCPTRSGSGLLLCPTRSGSGLLLCPTRSGSGPLLCPTRSGSGPLLCPTRSGSGLLLCPTRSGSGPLLCPTGNGSDYCELDLPDVVWGKITRPARRGMR